MSELERILGPDKLARPVRQGGKRDPSPNWDVWYEEFAPTDRRRLGPFMGGAVSPDVLATWLGVSVDDALRQWRTACLSELKSCQLAEIDAVDWQEAEECAPLEVYGPQELAALLGVQENTVHVWRKRDRADGRGRLPEPNMVVSRVPLWLGVRVREWAEATGRLEEVAGF